MHGVLLDTSTNGTQWGAIAIALLTLIYIAFVRPLKKGKKDPLARKPTDTALAQQRSMERDMTALLVEYEQMMRKMTAQLETRVAKLELLIRDADERLGALRAIDIKVPTGADLPAARPGRDWPTAGAFDVTPGAVPESEPPRHRDVYALADEGLSYRQIAQRLDRPYGEIELILALRSKDAAPAARAIAPASEEPVSHEVTAGETEAGQQALRQEAELAIAGVGRGSAHAQPQAVARQGNNHNGGRRRKKQR